MNLEKIQGVLKKLAPAFAVLGVYVVGIIHAVAIDALPISQGLSLIIDVTIMCFTDPFSIVEGVLVYVMFRQLPILPLPESN